MSTTVQDYKEWVLKQIKDFRVPEKSGMKVVTSDGEQKKREYADARADAARTGDPKDIERAKRLKAIVEVYDNVVKARDLTTKAQSLYENIDSNRKKLKSLQELDEGDTDEAKKIQRQLERARASLKTIEAERDAFGKAPKKEQSVVQQEAAKEKPAPLTPIGDQTPAGKTPTPSGTGDKGKQTPATPPATPGAKQEEALLAAADKDYALPETIFKHVPSLNALLKEYVNTPGMTLDNFRKKLRDDVWFKKNSAEIKQRYVQLYNYQDLVASGQADGSTDYEKQISTLERKLADKARTMGSSAANDPAALRRAAENMYITNVGIDDAMTTDFLAAAIKPIGGTIAGKPTMGYSGEALDNYKTLVKAARDNGFQISDILPGGANEQQVLANIASGKIDIDRVKQDARKLAAQGQPQYVRDLLAQGYDLAQVFKPYRQVMATVLDIGDPDQIDLNDPLLRTAITDKGDMNLYDFKKALRQDDRWQYTEQAKKDVSNAALTVLKDFGFQG
jgi:hypothetical protein